MSGPRTYRVRRGDTLSTIALRKGVALGLLARINHLSDANRIYVDQVLQLEAPSGSPPSSASETGTHPEPQGAPGPGLRHTPAAAQASTAPRSIKAEDFLSPTRGSHSLAAIVIGCAEGNRTPRGGLVSSSFGHTDPGNGKRNLGSFSSQMTPERAQIILGKDSQQRKASQLLLQKADRALSTKRGRHQLQELLEGHKVQELLPEVAAVDLEGMRELIDRADRLQLEAMSGKLAQYTAAAQSVGLDPNHPLLIATYFDSFNQSEAASSRLLKQFSFIKAQKQGITQETMLAARVRSWIDPNTQKLYTHLDKKTHEQKEYGAGFKNIAKKNKQSLTQVIQADQGRRVGEMVRALAQWGASPAASQPTKTQPQPTKAQTQSTKAQSPQTPPSSSESKGSTSSPQGLLSTLPPRLAEIAQGQRVLIPGSKDSLVTQLQSLLAFCMPQWSDKLKQEWGRFGQSTQSAVSEVQRAHKLPSATGALNASTLELLKFDVYSRYFQLRGAALDTRINTKTLVGLRIPTSTRANDGKGVYDDRLALLWKEASGRKRVKEFLANTDPAGNYLAKGYGADVDHKNGKELGRLEEGYYVYHKSTGYHGWLKGKPVLRSRGSVPIEYDVNHDGNFNKLDAIPGKSPTADDILIHAGSRQSTGSAGCMTLPPDEFQQFWSSLGTQEDIKYLLVTLDGATSPPGSPHVTPPAKKDPPATNEPTAERMVQAALRQAGKKYVFGTEVKLDDPDPKAFDCSELVQWAVHQAGGRITDGSQAQRRSCHDHHTTLPVSQALKTRGALLFNDHHVAISLGDGMTIEAANSKVGVKSLKASGRGWTDAGLVPGLIYGDSQPKSSPKQSPPVAQTPASQPVSTAVDASHLGVLSSRYESNGNPGCVSGGVDDPGGISYGLYQFATTQGTPRAFAAWLYGRYPIYYKALKDLNPGTQAFSNAWRQLAKQDPSGFGKAQHDYIAHKFYFPAKSKIESNIKGLSFDKRSQTLNDVLWSTAVQHSSGGAFVIFRDALVGKSAASLTDAQIATAVYRERGRQKSDGTLAHFTKIRKATTRQSLLNRFKHELADALRLIEEHPALQEKTPAQQPQAQTHAQPHAPPHQTPTSPTQSASTPGTQGALALGNGVTVNTQHPSLRTLATAALHNGKDYSCVKTTRTNMIRLGIPGAPGPTGSDNNNPRGAMAQMFHHGWTSVPFPGSHPESIRSPYGNATADAITAAQYKKLALGGQIPDGAIIFQTRHGWDYSGGSSGNDMGVVRDHGQKTHNYASMNAIVYKDCKSVVIMVPREALQRP